jgi:LPS export ABC transporter protein LptC
VKTLDQVSDIHQPARRLTKRKARRHSSIVRALRMILPTLSVGIFALFLIMATPRTVDPTFQDQFGNLETVGRDLRMEMPRFTGEDNVGRPYELVAGAATQDPRAPKLIALENPEALQADKTKDQALVTAKSGLYRVEDKMLDLNTNVELEQGIGTNVWIMRTEAATLALENQTVTTQVGVYGENNRGSIRADKMTAYKEEGRTVFENNVRMILKPKQREEEPADTTDTEPDEETDGTPKT